MPLPMDSAQAIEDKHISTSSTRIGRFNCFKGICFKGISPLLITHYTRLGEASLCYIYLDIFLFYFTNTLRNPQRIIAGYILHGKDIVVLTV